MEGATLWLAVPKSAVGKTSVQQTWKAWEKAEERWEGGREERRACGSGGSAKSGGEVAASEKRKKKKNGPVL